MMFLQMAPVVAVFALLLFVPAGSVHVPAFWAYLLVLWVSAGATMAMLGRKSPELLKERLRPPHDRDKATRRLVALPFAAHLVVAGLDVGRFHWSPVPLPLQGFGFLLVGAAMSLVAWTLLSNPFASSAVRIQAEREQRVISSGPYAVVRHPMYSAVVLVCVGGGLALGSVWSSVALLPVVLVFLRRTRLEDRMLHDELPGYRDYAGRVKWRLVPGIF